MTGMTELPKKTALVGARGRMGAMFIRLARERGMDIEGLSHPFRPATIAPVLSGADLVILAVPAATLKDTLAAITPFMAKDAILSDIISVKEQPMRLMAEAWAGAIVGTHPLFGPKNAPGDDLPVALVPGKNCPPKAMELVANFYLALGCRVFETTAAKHDHAMARIQNLNFITNLAYFAALAGQEDLLPFLTPSFGRRKKSAAKMLTEDAEMFGGLFEANPHSQEAVRQYRKTLNIAASGDIEVLARRAQWWFDTGMGMKEAADHQQPGE